MTAKPTTRTPLTGPWIPASNVLGSNLFDRNPDYGFDSPSGLVFRNCNLPGTPPHLGKDVEGGHQNIIRGADPVDQR